MPFDAVFWDHDDTLLPTFDLRARAWQEAVRRATGIVIDGAEQLTRHMGEPIEVTALRQGGGDAAIGARLVAEYRGVYGELSDRELACFPGIAPTLAALRERGIKHAVVTSKLHAIAQRELQHCGIEAAVDVLVGSDDVTRHKPDPEPLLRAAALLGVEPARVVMVGDTPADVHAARAAGARAAAALWGTRDPGLLRAEMPTFLLTAPTDLVPLCNRR